MTATAPVKCALPEDALCAGQDHDDRSLPLTINKGGYPDGVFTPVSSS